MTQIDEPAQTTLFVEKARAGNKFAYEQLVNLFQEGIFRMVYYRTHSTMDAEDITQDIFIQAFKNLSRLKGTEKFKSWLYSIAVNKVRDFHRKKRFRNLFSSLSDKESDEQTYPEAADSPDAMDKLIKQDFWKQVMWIMSRGEIALNLLLKLKDSNSNRLNLNDLKRKQLVCDMERPLNIWHSFMLTWKNKLVTSTSYAKI